ncbi:uncharacterized protein [Typha latifolia]|uniref:uncharacterized protein isoform X1 n=1 Tax=Typha latifolia TaxID=4733 RepID=UPI003C2D0B79
MAQSYFLPLRWESTGDQWWYASPIDWAAANGHYDLVRELLHLDTNLLIKLTSLRRIRRLETVWDDDARLVDASKCRAIVARSLLLECESKNGRNTLIRAGYGGWLLYTAAAAGDIGFVQGLLDRDPLLVFGEGEYGVTDILYAAARSKNSDVFRLLLDFAVSPRCSTGGGREEQVAVSGRSVSVFRWEMVNRAVHAASRGGNLEILKELLDGTSDILAYRDVQGSTILHAAADKGQVEVVKHLVASFDIISSRDNQSNTALHVAAFQGHLSVIEALITAFPSLEAATNNAGDTFLHMAVTGFRTPGFRRLDRQLDFMKQLTSGTAVDIQNIINARNHDGRTVLHMAVIGNVHSDLVELLMSARSINVNIRDADGMTPLDLLRQHPRSASSEILIKQLISAGGVSKSKDHIARSAIASHLKMQGIGNSPGTSFTISDAEIFLYTGIEASDVGGRLSSCSSSSMSELANFSPTGGKSELSNKKQRSARNVSKHFKILLSWSHRKVKKYETPKKLGEDDDSLDSFKKWSQCMEAPTPLRQQFSMATSILSNRRTLGPKSSMPSPSATEKFAATLKQSPTSPFSRSSMSSPPSGKQKGICLDNETTGIASSSNPSMNKNGMTQDVQRRPGLFNGSKITNRSFCFGAHGLTVDDSVSGQPPSETFNQALLSVS